jgi:hypothetical protein
MEGAGGPEGRGGDVAVSSDFLQDKPADQCHITRDTYNNPTKIDRRYFL